MGMDHSLQNPNQPHDAVPHIDLLSARTVLFVGAHPDDIEFYCGATVAKMLAQGAAVHFLIATMGGRGRNGLSGQRLRETRRRHQRDSARILGGAKVTMFDYPDKTLQEHTQDFAGEAAAFIRDLAPDYVISWDPEFIYNPHPDHRGAATAVARLGLDNLLFYGTRAPNLWIDSSIDHYRLKIAALRAHRTETPWYYWWIQKAAIDKRMLRGGAMAGTKYAEGLRAPL